MIHSKHSDISNTFTTSSKNVLECQRVLELLNDRASSVVSDVVYQSIRQTSNSSRFAQRGFLMSDSYKECEPSHLDSVTLLKEKKNDSYFTSHQYTPNHTTHHQYTSAQKVYPSNFVFFAAW